MADSEEHSQREEITEVDINRRLSTIIQNWYDVEISSKLNFPEYFEEVPATQRASRLWRTPMSAQEVLKRLLGEVDDVGPNQIPSKVSEYFSELVGFTSKRFSDWMIEFESNDEHLKKLEVLKIHNQVPLFLRNMKIPKLNSEIFRDAMAQKLQSAFGNCISAAQSSMRDLMIEERKSFRRTLLDEADRLSVTVKDEAISKWMSYQGGWNSWDHICPVTNDTDLVANPIPVKLSTVVFKAAMDQSNIKVTEIMERWKSGKADISRKRIQDQQKRRQASARATALPLEEAEKSIEQRLHEAVQPLKDQVAELQNQINGDAPMNADTDGAVQRSATEARIQVSASTKRPPPVSSEEERSVKICGPQQLTIAIRGGLESGREDEPESRRQKKNRLKLKPKGQANI